ncbi:MAG TPA: hypothetical protein VKO20_01705 [Desulfosalsimonadaceae bacterium]|nr:hypothetical protein [Desulfosalsimonadaceae bacterium]
MEPNSKPTASIHHFPLRHYTFSISLDRLKRGIDNVRHDVYISPELHRITNRLIFQLILYYAKVSASFHTERRLLWHNEIAEFKRQCHAVLLHGINTAKSSRETQIDVLAQISLAKLLSEAITRQFEEAVQHLKTVIRSKELEDPRDPPLALREEVAAVIYRKDRIIQKTGADIFQYFQDVQHELNKLRASNFGEQSLIPPEIFANPILQAAELITGSFMIENYVLIGHRIEDPVNYTALLNLLTSFLAGGLPAPAGRETQKAGAAKTPFPIARLKPAVIETEEAHRPEIDSVIRHVPNMELLFDFDKTRTARKKIKSSPNKNPDKIRKLKNREKEQKKLLNQFFRLVSKELIIDGIAAPYMMQCLFQNYCPPLMPEECLQYLIIPKTRKTIIRKLNRYKRYYSQNISVKTLDKTIRRIKRTPKRRQRRYLIRFLRDFARYHRDLVNYQLVKEAADSIHIRTDPNTIRLSRENRTLYEFMLSHEERAQTRAIRNHAVLKADIRGSTTIVREMKGKQQNPATNFSMNFFEPINNILSLYGANKTFIEGDAIILSILEHADAPGHWYCVSRACGLAINILLIVSRYNQRNRMNRLPMLDIGIGIGFAEKAPTFFYDNDNQIMISPAINQADRLSECSKAMRRKLRKANFPFNVYLYQPAADKNPNGAARPGLLRYNVKGVELDAEGFQKLSDEIHLKRLQCRIPEMAEDPLVFHTGKFPTTGGRYQRLLIREARIPEVSMEDFRVLRYTERKYYEVCTSRRAYAHVRKHV